VDRSLEELVALERSALERWIKLDPQGDLDLQAPEVTYFDPFTGAPERVLARWNSTEVYSRVGGTWKIIHRHWSYIQPELKQPGS
jgi:hypothetical protein